MAIPIIPRAYLTPAMMCVDAKLGMATSIPPGLAAIAAGRDYITTPEFGRLVTRANQTIRKNYCLTGECFGIRPVKVGNRLLWPVAGIAALLQGKEVSQ